MSYDLAVWEGERPADDKAAGRVFSDLYDRYIDGEVEEPPSERVATYVAALLERWCDLTEDEEDTSPWSTGPLIGEASGPLIYFPCAGAWPRRRPPTRRPWRSLWGWSASTCSRTGSDRKESGQSAATDECRRWSLRQPASQDTVLSTRMSAEPL